MKNYVAPDVSLTLKWQEDVILASNYGESDGFIDDVYSGINA